jgi:cyclase
MTVGGGIRSIEDVGKLLRAGADKIAVNTAAVKRPELIAEVSRKYGSQCMVLSIEAKRHDSRKWEIYTDCGRERTSIDAVEWAKHCVSLGAGEILITSIDQEGTRQGFDTELMQAISNVVNVPIIASGGYGQPEHLHQVVSAGADAVAFADVLHYNRTTLESLRSTAIDAGYIVRAI